MIRFRHVAAAAVAASGLLPGCTIFNPYVRSPLLDCTVSRSAQPTSSMCVPENDPFAGGAATAIDAADDQRRLYLKAANMQYGFNTVMGAGVIGLTADAIYKGIATGGTTNKSFAAISAGGAFLYGTDQWLHSKPSETAYIDGFRAITCTLLRSRALLLTAEEYKDFSGSIDAFEGTIAQVDRNLSMLQIKWDAAEEHGSELASGELNDLKRETGNVIHALVRARKLLIAARSFQAEANASGQTVRNQVNLIVATVSANVAQSEPDISSLKGLLAAYTDPSKGISDLQAVSISGTGSAVALPAETSSSSGNSNKKASASPGGVLPAAAAAAAPAVPAEPTSQSNIPWPPPNGQITFTVNTYQQRVIDRATIWVGVADLYKYARSINAVLARAQNFYVATKHIDVCDAGGPPPLEVTGPSGQGPASVGDTLKYTVTGGTGIPAVTLTGTTGTSSDAKTQDLVLAANGNSLVATVTILPGASGTLALVATDAGKPPQTAKVSIDVDSSGAKAQNAPTSAPTSVATAGDKSVQLSFSTPTEKSGTLTGYTVKITSPNGTLAALSFAKPDASTTATPTGGLTGTIVDVSGGKTSIEIKGLTDGTTYTVGLTAHFSGAGDVAFADANNVAPIAAAPARPAFVATPGDKSITLVFSTPTQQSAPPTSYTVTVSVKGGKAEDMTLDSAAVGAAVTSDGGVKVSIQSVTGGKTTLEISALTNGSVYSVGLKALFKGATPVTFKTVGSLTPKS